MDPFAQQTTGKSRQQQQAVNPFAKALSETEQSLSRAPQANNSKNPFSEALARTGGRLTDQSLSDADQDPAEIERQRQEMIKQQKKDALRKKLHDQVNPVQTTELFSAKEKRVAEELEKTREELKLLAKELAGLRMDIDIETTKVVVNPGQQGAYYITYFQKLRAFIMLLRQKVRSARTWAKQMNAKKKKKRKVKGGLDRGGNEAKTVHDMMHHERSTAYSGS